MRQKNPVNHPGRRADNMNVKTGRKQFEDQDRRYAPTEPRVPGEVEKRMGFELVSDYNGRIPYIKTPFGVQRATREQEAALQAHYSANKGGGAAAYAVLIAIGALAPALIIQALSM